MAALPQKELLHLCLQLARYKKENKELLNYLLFDGNDEQSYIRSVKAEIEEEFKVIHQRSFFQAKKGVRRILRILKKYIKYSGKKETEVELLLFFCNEFKKTKRNIRESKTMIALYQRQLINIHKAMAGLHEDVQFDYQQEIASLSL